MSGQRRWVNIKHKKSTQDAKRGVAVLVYSNANISAEVLAKTRERVQ